MLRLAFDLTGFGLLMSFFFLLLLTFFYPCVLLVHDPYIRSWNYKGSIALQMILISFTRKIVQCEYGFTFMCRVVRSTFLLYSSWPAIITSSEYGKGQRLRTREA
jgi:hypothetical protein